MIADSRSKYSNPLAVIKIKAQIGEVKIKTIKVFSLELVYLNSVSPSF